MRHFLFIILFLVNISIWSVYSQVFYASGGQLVPLEENSTISLSKEVINISRKGDYAYVTTNYIFTNSGKERDFWVGFEAPGTIEISLDELKSIKKHPYIDNFQLQVNNVSINNYKFSITEDTEYSLKDLENSQKKSRLFKKIGELINEERDYFPFSFVYYFKVRFKKGKNNFVHTYRFQTNDVGDRGQSIEYELMLANRWANHQVDDFTLNIQIGDEEVFEIDQTFFNNKNDWQIDDGISVTGFREYYSEVLLTQFATYSGGITFHSKNFKPQGNIFIIYDNSFEGYFDYKENNLPDRVYQPKGRDSYSFPLRIYPPTNFVYGDETSYKILKNLPYAVRGYVFKTPSIQQYYQVQEWYKPNPNYKAKLENLSPKEKKWLKKVEENHNKNF